jgi:hypothetical protein
MRSLDFFKLSNPSSLTVALVSTQPLTEMSTRNLPGGKRRPARKTVTASQPSLSRFYRKCGNLDVSKSHRPPGPIAATGLALLFLLTEKIIT